jgi:hypothetical protein
MKPAFALAENCIDLFHIQLEGVGDIFRGLSVIMSPRKNILFKLGPLTESPENFLKQPGSHHRSPLMPYGPGQRSSPDG